MASSLSWYKYTPIVYGLDQFGVSAPSEKAIEHFGFTQEKLSVFIKNKLK